MRPCRALQDKPACRLYLSADPILYLYPCCYHDRSYADSKTLTDADRARLFKALAADTNCIYAADLLSAQLISGQMLGRARVSLNAVAEQSTIGLIQSVLDAGVQVQEVS